MNKTTCKLVMVTTIDEKITDVRGIFSPSAPITRREKFYGRCKQCEQIEATISEAGQHIVLYGERGIGKTSLANVILAKHRADLSFKITLHRKSSFNKTWIDILTQLKIQYTEGSKTKNSSNIVTRIDATLKLKQINAYSILSVFKELHHKRILMVFDEFDVVNQATVRGFTDLIKNFSDNLPHVTLLIVGIASSVRELLGAHASIERCIKQIVVPRMNREELSDIIDSGLNMLKFFIQDDVKEEIISLSQGLPYYVHLITKHAVISAIQMRYNTISNINLTEAVNHAIENVYESIYLSYQEAMFKKDNSSIKQNERIKLIEICALANGNDIGAFSLTDLTVTQRQFQKNEKQLQEVLSKFCLQEAVDGFLQKIETEDDVHYRFKSPLLKAYILLKLYQEGKIRKKQLHY